MKTLRTLIAALVVLGASAASDAKEVALTGKVGDAMCGATHMMANDAPMCTSECIKKGSDYALIVGDSVYTLKADAQLKAQLAKHAGTSVTVKGDQNGSTIQVTGVVPAK